MGDKLVSVLDLSNLWVWAEILRKTRSVSLKARTADRCEPSGLFPNQNFSGSDCGSSIRVLTRRSGTGSRSNRYTRMPKLSCGPGPCTPNVEVKINEGEGFNDPGASGVADRRAYACLSRSRPGKNYCHAYVPGRAARLPTFDGQPRGKLLSGNEWITGKGTG